jgi:hypothetical protein
MVPKSQSGFPIYQLKVTLRGIQPPIWRRLQVASDITLYELHRLLQVAMGWMDCHLHEFARGHTLYGTSDREFGIARLPEKKIRLLDVLFRPRDKMTYQYDFGDSWEHNIVLERILKPSAETSHPICLAGERACPPEDCGGIPGYYELLEALADTEHPEHDHLMEWTGGGFDPERFDLEGTNRSIQPKQKRGKARG